MTRNNHDHENKLEQDLEHTKPYTHLKRMIASQQSGLNANGELNSDEARQSVPVQDHRSTDSRGMAAAIKGVQAASGIRAITRNTDALEGQGPLSQNIRALRAAVRGVETPVAKSANDPASIGDPVSHDEAHGDSSSMNDSSLATGLSHDTLEIADPRRIMSSNTELNHRNGSVDSVDSKISGMDDATKNYPGLSNRVESELLFDSLQEPPEHRLQENLTNEEYGLQHQMNEADRLQTVGSVDGMNAKSLPKTTPKGTPRTAPKSPQSKKPSPNGKNEKGGQGGQGGGKKRKKKLPIWLLVIMKMIRILLVPVLCITAMYVGVRIGYVHFGEQSPDDIWDVRTWKHLFDLIFADG